MSDNKGQDIQIGQSRAREKSGDLQDFVLEKDIFSNVFEKDIRRVFLYKRAERLAKAIHLITPAFHNSPSLRNRLDTIAMGLVDGAILPPVSARVVLARELLALSSVLSIARAGGLLSPMNADLVSREAHVFLAEVASYEEPRLFFDEVPSLATLSRGVPKANEGRPAKKPSIISSHPLASDKGHVSDTEKTTDRKEAIMSVIKDKGTVFIKDISTIVRGVSEKTIQRELQKLVQSGALIKRGERRWTAYSLPTETL